MRPFNGDKKDVPIIVCGLFLVISVAGVAPSGAAVKELSNAEPPLFADGFESGDTTEWSVTSP